jgi:hypothetical protein
MVVVPRYRIIASAGSELARFAGTSVEQTAPTGTSCPTRSTARRPLSTRSSSVWALIGHSRRRPLNDESPAVAGLSGHRGAEIRTRDL